MKTGGEIETGDLKKVQRGDTKYATLTAALAEADNGDTITFLVDYDAANDQITAGNNYYRFPITKSLIIDGNNHNLTVIGRGLAPGMGATSNVDITFKDINIRNSTNEARCIDTRGNIGTLTLDNATLDTQGASGQYTQPLTIGGNQATAANVIIKNGSVIQTNDDATAYYAIITFNPVNMSITGSTITGWAAIYMKGVDGSEGSHGSIVNIDNSTINSMNVYDGNTNAFSAFVFEDNNITVNLTNSRINITAASNQQQGIAGFIYQDRSVNPPADINTQNNTVNLGDGNIVTMNGTNAVLALNHTETSKLSVTGGTFNVDPTDFCAPGYVATQSGNVWTVQEANGVAQIGNTIYATLAEAVSAASENGNVKIIKAGNYTIPAITKTLTIEAAVDGVEVEHTTDAVITTIASGKTATFKNITFELGSTVDKAQKHGFGTLNGDNGALVMDGCTVNGALNLFGVSTFTNCTFNASGIYNIWAVNADANFTGCAFNNTNRAVNVYDQKHTGTQMNVSFTNCTFSASQKKKAAVNIHHNPPTVGTPANYAVSINNCTTTGTWAGTVAETGEPVGATICNSTLWMISDIENWAEGDITVSVDGVAQDVVAASVGTKYYQTLPEALAAATDGQTVTLLSNIQTTAQIEVDKTMTLDLNGKTIQYTGTEMLSSGVIMVLRGANLTINDSGTAGAIVSGDNAYAAVALTKKGETSTADAQLTVNGGSLTGYYYAITGNGTRHGTVITVKGGTLVGTNGCAIYHPQNGTLTITGGSLSGSDTGVELRSGTLVIQGGAFSASKTTYACNSNGNGPTTEGAALAIAQHNTNQPIVASISGGTFNATKKLSISNPENNAFDNVQVNGLTELFGDSVVIPEGYLWKDTGLGSTLVKAVAQIGEVKYESLAEAVAAVPTDGTKTTIQMIADETMATEAKLTVAANQNIVLDLNGKTISGSHAANDASFYFITNKGTLEITDTSSGKNGKITASWSNANYSYECVTIYNLGGTLTLSAGKVETTSGGLGYAINNSSNAWGEGDDKESVFNMTGGTLNAPSGDAALRVYQNCGGYATPLSHNLVNISGGTIATGGIFLDETVYKDNANPVGDGILTDVTISGGEIHGLIDLKMRHSFNTTFHITGGTFVDAKLWIRKHSEWHASVAEPTAPIFFISGGNFSFVNNMAFGLEYDCDGTSWTSYTKPYSITGGTFSVDPSDYVAAGYAATGTGNVWTVEESTEPENWINYAADSYESVDETNRIITIANAAQLAKLAKDIQDNDANPATFAYMGYTFKLTADIDLSGKIWTPIGADLTNYYQSSFRGTFDGNGHRITNMHAVDDEWSGLFGPIHSGMEVTIKDLTIDTFTVESNHYAGGIVGWVEQGTQAITFSNCVVSNGAITSSPHLKGNKYDDGDKVGGICGFAYKATSSTKAFVINNNTVSMVNITAYRDLGGLLGYAENMTVSGNTVTNVNIYQNNTNAYKEYAISTYGVLVGRNSASTISEDDNTVSNVSIYSGTPGSYSLVNE